MKKNFMTILGIIIGIIEIFAAIVIIFFGNWEKLVDFLSKRRVYIGVGERTSTSSFWAGKNAARDAIEKCKGNPNFGIVFVPAKLENVERVVEGVGEEFKDIPWIGCTSSAGIINNRVTLDSVICIAIRSKYMEFGAGVGENVRATPTESGEISILKALLNCIRRSKSEVENWPYKTLIMFPSGIIASEDIPCIEKKTLNGISKHIDEKWNVIGGSAAGRSINEKSYQFINGKCYEDAVVCGVIYSKVKIKVAIGLGYKDTGKRIIATKTSGFTIVELNKKSAKDEFAKMIAADLSSISNENLINIVKKNSIGYLDNDDNFCWCTPPILFPQSAIKVTREIEQGKVLAIIESNEKYLIQGCENAVKKTILDIDKKHIVGLFLFPCMLYKEGLSEEDCNKSIKDINAYIGEKIPLIGFYTFGEQGRNDSGKLGQLNQSVAAMVITREF